MKKLLFYLLSGTTLGVMFAPKRGSEFQKDIKNEIEYGGNGLNSVQKNLGAMSQDVASTATAVYHKENVQEVVGKARETADDFVDDVKKDAEKRFKRIKRSVKRFFKGIKNNILSRKSTRAIKAKARIKARMKRMKSR